MKTAIKDIKDIQPPLVAFDPALETLKSQSLFPKKLALANEQLKGAKLPPRPVK